MCAALVNLQFPLIEEGCEDMVLISFVLKQVHIKILHLNLCTTSPVLDPSPVTQRRGERVQDHLSAHARAKPIVAHIASTCLFRREIQKLARKLFQHAAEKNVGERS